MQKAVAANNGTEQKEQPQGEAKCSRGQELRAGQGRLATAQAGEKSDRRGALRSSAKTLSLSDLLVATEVEHAEEVGHVEVGRMVEEDGVVPQAGEYTGQAAWV